MDAIMELRKVFKTTLFSLEEKQANAEALYWLYRTVKDNPAELQIAFLLEANRLQKNIIERLMQDE